MNIKAAQTQRKSAVELDTVFDPPARDTWVELALAGMGEGATIEQVQTQTLDGISIQTLYDAAPKQAAPLITNAQSRWDNRVSVLADGTDAAKANILSGLNGGATSLEIHVNASTSIIELLNDVQLAIARVSLRAGMDYDACSQALTSLATAQGISPDDLHCSFNADPLQFALANGGLDHGIDVALQNMAQFSASSITRHPQCKSVLVDAAIHHNAGATPVEELHAAIATATLYVEHMIAAGMTLENAQKSIAFQIALDADSLLGVAKTRALHALWQHVLKSLGKSDAGPSLQPTCVVAETSQRYFSTRQPWNNHLRNLAACTAACMAGTDTIIVHRHDKLSNATDTDLGLRMARNIPIILERECGLRKVSDPLGGSFAVENLTHQLIQHAWQSLSETDTSAGWLDELQRGAWQQRLARSHQNRVARLIGKQMIAVGVNEFTQPMTNDEKKQAATDARTVAPNYAAVWSIDPLTGVRDAEHFEQNDNGTGDPS